MSTPNFEYDYSGSETAAEKLETLSTNFAGIKGTCPTTTHGAGPAYDEIIELLAAIDTLHNSFNTLITNSTNFINNSEQYFQTEDATNSQAVTSNTESN